MVASTAERILEARDVIADLIRQAGIGEPPVDLHAVAALRGIRKVEFAPLKSNEYGLLRTGRRGHTVTINSKHRNRARFTLAHEVAHTLVDHFEHSDVDVPLASRKPRGASALETMCDEIAAELLFPYDLFQDALGNGPATIDAVLHLARLFDGSIMATAKRVGDVTEEPVQVISWVRQGSDALRAGQRSGSGFLTCPGASPYRSFHLTESAPVRAFHSGKRETGTEVPVPQMPWNVYECEAQRFNGAKNGYVLSLVKPVSLTRS